MREIRQTRPVGPLDSVAAANGDWVASLLSKLQIDIGSSENPAKCAGVACGDFSGKSADRSKACMEHLCCLEPKIAALCTSPMSIGSLLHHTSLFALLGVDDETIFVSMLATQADSLPALAELRALINLCEVEIVSSVLNTPQGYASLVLQRQSVQRKLHSIADYAQACHAIGNLAANVLVSRIAEILQEIEKRYFKRMH